MNLKKGVFYFKNPIFISSFAAAAGEKEAAGPLNGRFDRIFKDYNFCDKSYEIMQAEMQLFTATKAVEKANLNIEDVDVICGGDLLNQCVGTSYAFKNVNVPFLGLYGACATMAEALIVSCVFLNFGHVGCALAVSASNFYATQRQFRFPARYLQPRPKTAQKTATAAGAVLLKRKDFSNIVIRGACVGKVVDFGVKNASNMGAIMAPAAADSAIKFLKGTGKKVEDFDLIVTGDLGRLGAYIFCQLMKSEGYFLNSKYNDCGLMLYGKNIKNICCGGSGAGCSASVLCADILYRLKNKKLKNVMFIGTGALHSKATSNQKATIPAIAHIVWFEGV